MTTTRNRPGEGPRTAHETAWTAGTNDTASAPDTRPRCARCKHPLAAPRSVARGFGPKCWPRTDVGALELERDVVGRRLAGLARRVARLDLAELATVATGLSYAFGCKL